MFNHQHEMDANLSKLSYDYSQPQTPLLPPPMPPFTSSNYMDTAAPYTESIYANTDSYGKRHAPTLLVGDISISESEFEANAANYQPVGANEYAVSSEVQPAYIPPNDAYNPEEEVETWEPEAAWDQPPDLETPESPPMFEKEGFADPIEYDDSKNEIVLGKEDVDQRRLLLPPPIPPG